MSVSQLATSQLAADVGSLDKLKYQAGKNSPEAIRETAKQFESLFMREVLKSMREATMKSGMLDSAQGNLASDMLDQQFSVMMAGQKGGLSDMIARQLSRQTTDGSSPQITAGSTLALPALRGQGSAGGMGGVGGSGAVHGSSSPTASQANFVRQHEQAAQRVQQTSGIPSSILLGQAGHETGWGRSEIRMADGSSSYNLFGIKAGAGWTGKVATVTTTEYVNGVAQKTTAKFRAYDSYEQSFQDYAQMINQSPRYGAARQNTGSPAAYAAALQQAGYATDPAYATKVSRAINTTRQLQQAMHWGATA
ncbi:MAG: flagellar assembly peptidoglycan hydrolase FlgJ [Curvibacter sp.]|nr:flagellar assembly peptidoglycan hydrolase FlgJ [Curvibacter sp.]